MCDSGSMRCHDMVRLASCFDSAGPLLLCDAVGKYSFLLQTRRYDVALTVKRLLSVGQTKTSPYNVVGLVVQHTHTHTTVHTYVDLEFLVLLALNLPGAVIRATSPKTQTYRLCHQLDHHDSFSDSFITQLRKEILCFFSRVRICYFSYMKVNINIRILTERDIR